MAEESLYERLGGVFAIAAVIDYFSDEVVKNAVAGQGSDNPELREWHTQKLARLPGLKWMRTLWVCDVAGGPFHYVGTEPGRDRVSLEEAHRELEITPGSVRRRGRRAREGSRSFQRARAREERSAGRVCSAQGRGDGGSPSGRPSVASTS